MRGRIILLSDRTSNGRKAGFARWVGFLLANVFGTALAGAKPQSANSTAASSDAGLPLNFGRNTGDLDAMVKRGSIRALVLYSRTGFFYVDGKPEGIYYEALQFFEQFVNQKLHPRQHVQVTFIPVRPDQIEKALTDGVGDLIAYGLVVTPQREQRVAFSIPIQTDVKQIIEWRKGSDTSATNRPSTPADRTASESAAAIRCMCCPQCWEVH